MVLAVANNTSLRRRRAPVIPHICDFCLGYFIGVRQKKYCSKSCTEAACRARKAALIDALALQFAVYGLSRANVERAVSAHLERGQAVAVALGLEYFERQRVWETRVSARVLYGA